MKYIYIYLEKEEIGVKRRTLIPPKFSHYFQGRDIGPSSVGDTGGVELKYGKVLLLLTPFQSSV